jgi:hypothetical protein
MYANSSAIKVVAICLVGVPLGETGNCKDAACTQDDWNRLPLACLREDNFFLARRVRE